MFIGAASGALAAVFVEWIGNRAKLCASLEHLVDVSEFASPAAWHSCQPETLALDEPERVQSRDPPSADVQLIGSSLSVT